MARKRVISTSPYRSTLLRRSRLKDETPSPEEGRLGLAPRKRRPTQNGWAPAQQGNQGPHNDVGNGANEEPDVFLSNHNLGEGSGSQPARIASDQAAQVTLSAEARNVISAPVAHDRSMRSRGVRQAEQTIEDLKTRIIWLERSERRLKVQSRLRSEALRDIKAEARGSLLLLVEAESKLVEAEGSLDATRKERDRYRNWWLTEFHSLKAVIQLIPRRHDVEAIASSSLARYRSFRGE